MDIYDFLNEFNNNYDNSQSSGGTANSKAAAAEAQPAGGNTQSAPPVKPSGYPKTRAEAEALGYKPLTDTAPDIQPCDFGYPCNDCGYCH